MDQLVIEGGRALNGTVKIGGAKNSVLPLMAATLLTPGEHCFTNVPHLRDVTTMQKLLQHLGIISTLENHQLQITTDALQSHEAPYELVKTMRASVLVLGPLVARWGKAIVSLPGGCAIGARPIDLHLKALEQMGAALTMHDGYVEATAQKLKGAHITFDKVTVTGTENIMMAATLADGITVLENAAREPEVTDLANYLIAMGTEIRGAGTDRITIYGRSQLKAAQHTVIPDRIEAGTFLIAGAITGGTVTVDSCPPEYLAVALEKLKEAGCEITVRQNLITLKAPKKLKAINFTTAPYPGLATDLQAQFMALTTLAEGTSIITETIFDNRFQHALELKRLGADITLEGHTAIIKGVGHLSGAPMMATDLRASASLVLAGLAADGRTEIDRAYHIDRGYEKIEEKLKPLGAKISRQKGS